MPENTSEKSLSQDQIDFIKSLELLPNQKKLDLIVNRLFSLQKKQITMNYDIESLVYGVAQMKDENLSKVPKSKAQIILNKTLPIQFEASTKDRKRRPKKILSLVKKQKIKE